MKKLGLVGGMGPESTIQYYHDIVYGVQKKLGEVRFPNLTIDSVDLFKVVGLCEDKKYDELAEYLMSAINNLVSAGADFVVLSANTPHIVFDNLKGTSPVKLISIVEAACREAMLRGYKKVGLLGTIYTMSNAFFKTPFLENGIKVITPADEEMAYINDKIYNELEFGVTKNETISGFVKIIDRLKRESGVEAVILGCTELPLILNDRNSPVPCLDTMKIHIDEIIDEIIDEGGVE